MRKTKLGYLPTTAAVLLICLGLFGCAAGRVADDGGVLIFGASRETGLEVARILATRGEAVTAFVRPTSDRLALEALKKVKFIEGDALVPSDVAAALRSGKYRAVISTLGGGRGDTRPDLEGSNNVVDAAKAAGVNRVIIVTVIGTGDSSGAVSDRVKQFLGKVIAAKDKAEKYLMVSGLDWTIIRPGGLTSDPATGHGVLLTDQSTMGSISRTDLAQLVVKALDDPGTKGRIYHAIDRDMVGKAPM